jgi:hypothetical protein
MVIAWHIVEIANLNLIYPAVDSQSELNKYIFKFRKLFDDHVRLISESLAVSFPPSPPLAVIALTAKS